MAPGVWHSGRDANRSESLLARSVAPHHTLLLRPRNLPFPFPFPFPFPSPFPETRQCRLSTILDSDNCAGGRRSTAESRKRTKERSRLRLVERKASTERRGYNEHGRNQGRDDGGAGWRGDGGREKYSASGAPSNGGRDSNEGAGWRDGEV